MLTVTAYALGALLVAQVQKEQVCDGTTGKCAAVINTSPSGSEYGQVVRVIGGAAGGGTSSSFGAAFPASGTAAGFKDSSGTLMAPGNLDVAGNLEVTLRDAAGKELDMRQENENWNAADHGILMFGRDVDSVPNKYRALRLDASGNLYSTLTNASIAVTGTFWQTTQPVSIASMPSTPVTGTFWQATQPVTSRKAAANALSTAVSVSNSAVALPSSALGSRVSVCVYNNGSETIYLGGSGVTTTSGLPLQAGASFCDDMGAQVLYGIAATGPVNIRVLEN